PPIPAARHSLAEAAAPDGPYPGKKRKPNRQAESTASATSHVSRALLSSGAPQKAAPCRGGLLFAAPLALVSSDEYHDSNEVKTRRVFTQICWKFDANRAYSC
ncbi:MAG TPA: hypothetical protein PKA74_03165, partial [Bauldia sp.]|nr:hypothetical protein [Bauldia sp.]